MNTLSFDMRGYDPREQAWVGPFARLAVANLMENLATHFGVPERAFELDLDKRAKTVRLYFPAARRYWMPAENKHNAWLEEAQLIAQHFSPIEG